MPGDRYPQRTGPDPHPQDLECLVTTLEVAAIFLSPADGATFTAEELIAEVRRLDPRLDERDLRNVLKCMKTIRKTAGGRLELR